MGCAIDVGMTSVRTLYVDMSLHTNPPMMDTRGRTRALTTIPKLFCNRKSQPK